MKFTLLLSLLVVSAFAQEKRNVRVTDTRVVCEASTVNVVLAKNSIKLTVASGKAEYYDSTVSNKTNYSVDALEMQSINKYQKLVRWEEKTLVNGTVKGSGKSEFMDAYYNAKNEEGSSAKDKRIYLLHANIKGIGESTAITLVDNNFLLDGKPKTWGDFVSKCNHYQQKYNLPGLVNNVKSYAEANKLMLGYLVPGKVVQWIDKNEWQPNGSDVAEYERTNLNVSLSLSPLSKEKETISLVLGCDGRNISYNAKEKYYALKVTSSRDDIEVSGTRKKVNPSNFINASIANEGGKLALAGVTYDVDPEVIADLKKNGGKVTVNGTATLGATWKWNSGEDVQFAGNSEAGASKIVTNADISSVEIEDVDVKFTMSVSGSSYYSAAKSNSKSL